MASIEKFRPNPKDPKKRARWRARWRDPDGRQRTRVFNRKVDAENYLKAVEHKKLVGEYIDPNAGRITVKEWCESWRAVQVHRPSTMAQVESHFRKHLYPTLGNYELRAVKPSDVQAWVSKVSESLAPATTEVVYRYFYGAMKAAEHDRLISRTPCQRIKLPKIARPEVVPPTVEQVSAVADAITPRYRAAVVLAAGAGLRVGEVFGVQVDSIDFLRRQLKVEQQLLSPPNEPAVLGPPKTKSSVRTVPVSDVVLRELSVHMKKYPPVDGFVFTNEAGTPVRRSTFAKHWGRAMTKAKLEGFTFHGLRHHFASALIAAGCSVKAVQKALGHASASETLDTYSHLWPDDEDKTRAAIEALWDPPLVAPRGVMFVSREKQEGAEEVRAEAAAGALGPGIAGLIAPGKL